MFFYVSWIVGGMWNNRKVGNVIERMMVVSCLTHYVRKTAFYYAVMGFSYLVLLYGEEGVTGTDYVMVGIIFGNGIFAFIIQNWWLGTYKAAFVKADKDMMAAMSIKTAQQM
jgi:hypothetical protein